MTTSAQPDTLELDGWDPALLAPLTDEDFTAVEASCVGGEREPAVAPSPARRSHRRATPVQWSTRIPATPPRGRPD